MMIVDVVAAMSKEPMYTGEVAMLEGEQTGGRSGGKMKLSSVSSRRRYGGAPSGGGKICRYDPRWCCCT